MCRTGLQSTHRSRSRIVPIRVGVSGVVPASVAIPIRMGLVPREGVTVLAPIPRIAVIVPAVTVVVVALIIGYARTVRSNVEAEACLGVCRCLRNCDRGSCKSKSDDRAFQQRPHRCLLSLAYLERSPVRLKA